MRSSNSTTRDAACIYEDTTKVNTNPSALKQNNNVCSKQQEAEQSAKFNGKRLQTDLNRLEQDRGKEQTETATNNVRINKSFHHVRYVIMSLGGTALGFMVLLRLNATIGILNMVNQTLIYLEENPDADLTEYFGANYEESGEFEWNNEVQQMICSYYMISYGLSQLQATKFALKFGPRMSVAVSLAICAVSNLLTPLLAYFGWQSVVALRMINGLGAAAILPMAVRVIELWTPLNERQMGLTIVLFTQALSIALSPVISGSLAAIHWKWTFYGPGGSCLLFCLLWLAVFRNDPAECWFVSEQELIEIGRHRGDVYIDSKPDGQAKGASGAIGWPWTRALRYKSFYSISAVWFLYMGTFGGLTFMIPLYMRQVLKLPIMENGMICCVVSSGCLLASLWPLPIMQVLQQRYNYSVTACRRAIVCIEGIVVPSTLLYVAMFQRHQVILFTLNRMFSNTCDLMITATLMSHYSKTGSSSMLYGVINGIGGLATSFVCMASGFLLDYMGESLQCWTWILATLACMKLLLVLIFCTLVTSEPMSIEDDDDPKAADCEARPRQASLAENARSTGKT